MQLAAPSQYLLEELKISKEYITYASNIGYIIVPKNGDFVYKVFVEQDIYQKELRMYQIFKDEKLLIPEFEGIGIVDGSYVLKLQNIRKEFKRKNILKDLDLQQVATILRKIHTIDSSLYAGKDSSLGVLILGDIHSSNFFETHTSSGDIQLGIFDFSSVRIGEKEDDIADLYIDLALDDVLFGQFLMWYGLDTNIQKVYKYAFFELNERIHHGMNLTSDKKLLYYTFMLKLKNKINI